MATRRPLVVVDGALKELPDEDMLAGLSVAVTTNPVIVATEGQTEFAIPGGSASAIVWVFGNGRKLDPDEYTVETDGLSYTLDVAAVAGEEFQTVVFASFSVADTYSQAIVDGLLAAKFDKAGGEIAGRAYTDPALPAFSATPTFDCAASNVFEPAAMTANITAITMSNPAAGQTVQIRFLQDATGSRTVAVPSGAKIDGNLNSAANSVTWLVMTYSSRASRWEGNWMQVPA